jgi:hypothetical protein
MPIERVEVSKAEPCPDSKIGWKVEVAKALTKMPRSLGEWLWRSSLLGLGVSATLSGLLLWRNPGIIFGEPVEEQSIIQRLAAHPEEKEKVFELMSNHYGREGQKGLMLVAWEELDSLVGIWVKPADKFPGKSGAHDLTPDMKVLAGPFIFGECASTESIAFPGYVMVACPIVSSYDVWGYVAEVVEDDKATISRAKSSLRILAHRITRLIY